MTSVIVRRTGFFNVGLDEIAIFANVTRSRVQPAEHLYPLPVLSAEVQPAHFILVTNLRVDNGEITKRLQAGPLHRPRHRVVTHGHLGATVGTR